MEYVRNIFDLNVKSVIVGFMIALVSTIAGNEIYNWNNPPPPTRLILNMTPPMFAFHNQGQRRDDGIINDLFKDLKLVTALDTAQTESNFNRQRRLPNANWGPAAGAPSMPSRPHPSLGPITSSPDFWNSVCINRSWGRKYSYTVSGGNVNNDGFDIKCRYEDLNKDESKPQ